MNQEHTDYGSGRLNIRRPPLQVTVANIAGGCVILILACLSISYNYRTLTAPLSSLSLLGGLARVSAYDVGPMVTLAYVLAIIIFALFFLPSILFIGVRGLKSIWEGLVQIMKRQMPAKVPVDFRDSTDVIYALTKRAISIYRPTFDQLGKAQSDFIAVLFGKNARFLAPTHRKVVKENAAGLRARLLLFLLAVGLLVLLVWFINWLTTAPAGRILPGQIAHALTLLLTEDTAQQMIRAPFIWLLALQVFLGVIEYLSSAGLVPRMEPVTTSLEANDYYRGFGHPIQLLTRLRDAAKPLAWQQFPNRYEDVPLTTDTTVGVADTATFQCALLVEQQPRPVPSEKTTVGYLLLASGWFLRLAAFYAALFLLLPAPVRDFAAGSKTDPFLWAPLFVTVTGIAAVIALRAGGRFVRQATCLFESVAFRSEAIFVHFIGDLTRSDVRVGKSIADSIESANVAVRSDFTARLYAAELSSEAADLTAERELLALQPSPATEEWIRHFRSSISQLRDEVVRPIGVDLQSPEASRITQANVAMTSLRAIAAEQAKMEAQIEGREAPLLGSGSAPELRPAAAGTDSSSLADGEWKECPDCAERVRMRARKCRFCGHVFDEHQATDVSPLGGSVDEGDSAAE